MKQITSIPKNKPDFTKSRKRCVEKYVRREAERKLILGRCNKKDKGSPYFLCSHHEMETIRKSFNFKRDTKKGINTHTFTHNFKAPTGIAVNWQDERISIGKGLGCLQNYKKIEKYYNTGDHN